MDIQHCMCTFMFINIIVIEQEKLVFRFYAIQYCIFLPLMGCV